MKVAVVGSGIWGACSAFQLNKAGVDVELYDMWGAGNSRSGSGGASRIIRLAYGDDKIYTELTNNSFNFWEELSNESERKLYDECGMLWLISQDDNSYITKSKKYIEIFIYKRYSRPRNFNQNWKYKQIKQFFTLAIKL